MNMGLPSPPNDTGTARMSIASFSTRTASRYDIPKGIAGSLIMAGLCCAVVSAWYFTDGLRRNLRPAFPASQVCYTETSGAIFLAANDCCPVTYRVAT